MIMQLLQSLLSSGADGLMGGAGTAGARQGGGMTPYSSGMPSNEGLMGHGIGQDPGIYTGGPPGSGPTTPYDLGGESGAPQMPEPDNIFENLADVSGFANYGMTPPALPNAREGYGGLMGLSQLMDPNRNRKEDPFAPGQAGGLMAYLQALSRS